MKYIFEFPPCFITNFERKVIEVDDDDGETLELMKQMVDLFAKSEEIVIASRPQNSQNENEGK